MQSAMFSPNHFTATQQQPLATTAQQQLMQQQQMRRTTRSSQRAPPQQQQQQPQQQAAASIQNMPQGHAHQMQFQGIPPAHLQAAGAAGRKQLPDQLSYNPSLYVGSPDQQMLSGRPASVNPPYNASDIQFQFPTYEDIEDSSLLTTSSSHPYQSQLQSHSPDHHLLQELQGTVNTGSYNPADLGFSFPQFEDPMMAATGPPHPSANPFQGQLTSNSPDPMLGGDAFRYRVMQANDAADSVDQRAISPMFARQQQAQPQQQQQQQQQGVMNSAPGGTGKQNGSLFPQDGNDWRMNPGQIYAFDQYLGAQGQFPASATGTPQPHVTASGSSRQGSVAQSVQTPAVKQQMISVGPSDDIVETVPPTAVDSGVDGDVKPKTTKKKKQPQQSIVVPVSPKLVPGSAHMMMDMERIMIFDINFDEDSLLDPTGPVTISYEPVALATSKSPTSAESPDSASPPKTMIAKSRSAKGKNAKVVIQDPIAQMKERIINAIHNDDLSITKILSICFVEMKNIADDDKDANEKRVSWLKTVFDNGFDEFFSSMTGVDSIVKRVRKWMVDAWREDRMSAVILHGLQVYQKLSLDDGRLEEFKLKSVLNTFSRNSRDERVKQACTHILSKAVKITAKQEAEAKKAEAKAKTNTAKAGSSKPSNETAKVEDKAEAKSNTVMSKSDSADILKDAAKIASLATEDNKTGKRKPEVPEKDLPNKRVAANPTAEKPKFQLPIAPDASKASTSAGTAKAKASNEGFFANMQKAAKPKPVPAAPQPGGFTSIFDLLKEREAANAAAKSTAATEKPPTVVKKKKSVRWKPDSELKEVKIFQTELPEGEDGYDPMEIEGGMDAGLVKAKVRANLKEEAQALKNRNFNDYDDDLDMEWDSLTPIQLHWNREMVQNTCFKRMGDQHPDSQEARRQQEREKSVLAVHYSISHPAPPTAHELPTVNEAEQPLGEYWEAALLRPPPGWKRERNYLYGDNFQKKHMARAYMPQVTPPAPAVAPVDLTSILANLGGGQPAPAPAPVQPVVQEAPKSNQIASILAELQKLAPPTNGNPAPAAQIPQPAPAPAPAQNPAPQSNPLLALLGLQSQTPQPQAPAQSQLDLSKALQQLTQQPQPAQPQINPFGSMPFPFAIPQQPGQPPALPFNMPIPPPLLPGQNPLEFMMMYQAMMAQNAQQPQAPGQQFGTQSVNDVAANLHNQPTQSTDVKMNDDSDNYQPPEQTQPEKSYQEANNNGNNNNATTGGGKEGKGSWSKFGKKKKHFHQDQPPYKKNKGDNSGPGGKRVCAFWQAGNCLKKDDCQYSHDGPPGQGGSEQADQIRQHLYGKDSGEGGRSHDKKHKKFKKRVGYSGGSGSAADTAAASASNDWNGEMEY